MAGIVASFAKWWRGGGLGSSQGLQTTTPASIIVDADEAVRVSGDTSLQSATVWLCCDRRASTVASLPFMAYETMDDGQKKLARGTRLWSILHNSPNARMTPFDFWRVMVLNHDLRGNAYARIERDPRNGEAVSLWPMPADQVEPWIYPDGSMVYLYHLDGNVAVLDEANVLHIRNLGNGTVGLDKLSFMAASVGESILAQRAASKTWSTNGKPTGVLMLDHVLDPQKRKNLLERFGGMAEGNKARLYLLEANMKYQQISITPEQQQLLDSRRYGVEELCRWYDVPPVLAHHNNVTTWGSAVGEIVEGWQKLSLRPLLVSIEQAVMKRVFTPKQRMNYSCEFNQDALLRASLADRADIYSKMVQNGIFTRNEARQLENLPPSEDGNDLTAQTNLAPLRLLGTLGAQSNAAAQTPQAQ